MWKIRLREIVKQCINIAWYCTPRLMKRWVQKRHAEKVTKRTKEIFSKYRVSEENVYATLDQLGISGDVMVHSSLVDIGNIKGMHKPFVNYLNEHVTDNGNNILAIGIPHKGSTAEWLHSISTFDENAPIAMGRISAYYAKQEGACRSLKAEEYTSAHHLDETPFGVHSPYYKFLENDGYMLMIGAGLKYMTIGHIEEDMLGEDFPCRVYERKPHPVVIYKNGESIYHGQYYAHSAWRSAFRVPDFVLRKIRQIPSMRVVKLGAAEILYFSAREAIICELEELRNGNSIYGWKWISEECRVMIDKCIEAIKKMPKR